MSEAMSVSEGMQGCSLFPRKRFSETSKATDDTKPDLNIGETRVWRFDSGLNLQPWYVSEAATPFPAPKMNEFISPKKGPVSKGIFIVQPIDFQGIFVSFPGGT